MKIYKLVTNEIEQSYGAVTSLTKPSRTEIKSEYYFHKEKAEQRQEEIRNSLATLLGYVRNFEIVVKEIEVIE